MAKTCFIPISVSNAAFRTDLFTDALRSIERQYDTCVFLVADTLQIYNKAAFATSGSQLMPLIETFTERNSFFAERKSWLQKLRTKLSGNSIGEASWDFVAITDLSSKPLTDIFRVVSMLFSIERQLHRRIVREARRHVACHQKQAPPSEMRKDLAILYLIDEIAVNIYCHCVKGWGDEYYIGGVLDSVRCLYDGTIGLMAPDIVTALGYPSEPAPFDFMMFDPKCNSWSVAASFLAPNRD